MDLNLYLRVIWRFRVLVVLGVLLAVALAGLTMFKVSSKGLHYRQHETWASQAVLLITQSGFPQGRSVYPSAVTKDGVVQPSTSFADPSHFADLAAFYAKLAGSDAVIQLMEQQSHPAGVIGAAPVTIGSGSKTSPLPLLAITGEAAHPRAARKTAAAGAKAFITYLTRQQNAAGIPPKQRVLVQVMNQPSQASLVQGRKKTIPIVVFLTVLIATLGLAFILENLRPRVRAIETTALERPPESGLTTSQSA